MVKVHVVEAHVVEAELGVHGSIGHQGVLHLLLGVWDQQVVGRSVSALEVESVSSALGVVLILGPSLGANGLWVDKVGGAVVDGGAKEVSLNVPVVGGECVEFLVGDSQGDNSLGSRK